METFLAGFKKQILFLFGWLVLHLEITFLGQFESEFIPEHVICILGYINYYAQHIF